MTCIFENVFFQEKDTQTKSSSSNSFRLPTHRPMSESCSLLLSIDPLPSSLPSSEPFFQSGFKLSRNK